MWVMWVMASPVVVACLVLRLPAKLVHAVAMRSMLSNIPVGELALQPQRSTAKLRYGIADPVLATLVHVDP